MNALYTKIKAAVTPLNTLVIYDPIPFAGGSKVAINHLLEVYYELNKTRSRIIIATCNTASWQQQLQTTQNAPKHTATCTQLAPLYLPYALSQASQGGLFYAKQIFLMLQLLGVLLRHRRVTQILCISGPGVDAGALFLSHWLGITRFLFIQGPFAASRLALKSLALANQVYYLAGCRSYYLNVLQAMAPNQGLSLKSKSQVFINGLPKNQWPSASTQTQPVILWAASLLKWKGLTLLEETLAHAHLAPNIQAHICYIKPQKTTLACNAPPKNTHNTCAWEQPKNLDALRSQARIFVSTSTLEPFGLSILEAMAAGLCPVIPRDGAYWDTQLTHGINCIKYTPANAPDLTRFLNLLAKHSHCINYLGLNAQKVAQKYSAQHAYGPICTQLLQA